MAFTSYESKALDLQTAGFKKAKDQKINVFELLRAFVNGTGDLFDNDLRTRLFTICDACDVEGYLRLSSELDSLSKNYKQSDSVELVKGHRVLCSFLKKYPFIEFETELDPVGTAKDKWHAAERQCKETNNRLKNLERGDIPSFIHRARKIIADTLPDLTPSLVMKMLRQGEHGTGSVLETELPTMTSAYFKYNLPKLGAKFKATSSAVLLAMAAISCDPYWVQTLEGSGVRKNIPHHFASAVEKEFSLLNDAIEIADTERISFVFKAAACARPIGIGASLNMYIQLGVKAELERILKSVGVDLTDQTKNQLMALAGSQLGSLDISERDLDEQYSTIDLASASDTISLEIVRLLLPPKWFDFLCKLRHTRGELANDGTFIYDKFSAMGNGFTFPLETLIFWSVAKATASDIGRPLVTADLAVYGDDIVCPKYVAVPLCDNLKWCGFTVNQEKSFLDGPFKESCGADFYRGENVRPFYLKRALSTMEDIYFVCNSLMPRSSGQNIDRVAKGYSSIYRYIINNTPKNQITYAPLAACYIKDRHRKTVFAPYSFGLAVPLGYVKRKGVNPYLSTREKVKLFNAGYFGKFPKKTRNKELTAVISCNLPYAYTITQSAVTRRVPHDIGLYTVYWATKKDVKIDLNAVKRGLPLSMCYFYDYHEYSGKDINSNPSTKLKVPLRDTYEYSFRLRPQPNWDGFASSADVNTHPVWVV
jgi:hypothetical protein